MTNNFRNPSRINTYEQNRPQMKTGDVIAFSGRGGFSEVIKWATRSIYSHVGIIMEIEMGGGFDQSILLIESTTLTTLPEAKNNGEILKGVQIHWLSKRVETYNGSVWWVPLKNPLPQDKMIQMQSWLRDTRNKRTAYDSAQALGAGIDLFDKLGLANHPDFSTLFCSELVSKALQIAGVVAPQINPSEITPADVVNFNCLQHPPVLLKQD